MGVKKITNEIIERLSKPVLPGGVREEYYNVCGKPNCQCKHPENPRLHGPYTQLSYSVSGKSSTINISPKEIFSTRKAVKNFRTLKSLVNELALRYAEETRASGVSSLKQFKLRTTVKNTEKDKPDSVRLRLLRESRDKWKTKALARQAELEKKRIKIRDLEKSRDKWKAKFHEATKENKNIQGRLAKTEKKILKTEKLLGEKK